MPGRCSIYSLLPRFDTVYKTVRGAHSYRVLLTDKTCVLGLLLYLVAMRVQRKRKYQLPDVFTFDIGTLREQWMYLRYMANRRLSEDERIRETTDYQAYMATRVWCTLTEREEMKREMAAGLIATRYEDGPSVLAKRLKPCEWKVPIKVRPRRVSVIRYAPANRKRRYSDDQLVIGERAKQTLIERYRMRQAVIDDILARGRETLQLARRSRKQTFVIREWDTEERELERKEREKELLGEKQWQSPLSITQLLSGKFTDTPVPDTPQAEEPARKRTKLWRREARWNDDEDVEPSSPELFASPVGRTQLADEVFDAQTDMDLMCLEDILDDTDDEKQRKKDKEKESERRTYYLCEEQQTLDDWLRNDRRKRLAGRRLARRLANDSPPPSSCITILDSTQSTRAGCESEGEDEEALRMAEWMSLEERERELRVELADVQRRKWQWTHGMEAAATDSRDYNADAERAAARRSWPKIFGC